MTQHKGHVQVAFERRTGKTLAAWLLEHGPGMTRLAASDEIGYASPSALREYVARYMPVGFSFYRRPAKFSVAQIASAIERHAAGEPWPKIAISMGGDVNTLKDCCRRYRKRAKRAEQ